jgi:muramoyltetrapeptide carboxypeptidase
MEADPLVGSGAMPASAPSDATRRPARLRPGARVAVVAPSSPPPEPSMLGRGIRALGRLGLETVVAPGAWEVQGYLAGDDRRRAEDLLWALGDDSIDAVWCARGGYGAQRTVAALPDGELQALRGRDAKALIGFSDITVLHALVSARLGWVSFHGPVVSDLGRASEYTLAGVRDALFAAEPFTVAPHPDDEFVTTLVPGQAEGPLAGGCLTLLAALAGTPLQVDFAGRIAFFEDVHEPPYRIDGRLSQLLAAGCFRECAGIVIGEHVADLLAPLGIPCCFYLPLGHGAHLATLPIGARAQLDADQGVLRIVEPGVR